jgi:hypothetical protein
MQAILTYVIALLVSEALHQVLVHAVAWLCMVVAD